MITRKRLLAAVVLVLFAATACTASPTSNDTGSIAMMPFTDTAMGIQGVAPTGCQQQPNGIHNCSGVLTSGQTPALLAQQSFTMTLKDVTPLLQQQFGLTAMPSPVGEYKGSVFTWRRYRFDCQLKYLGETGPSAETYITVELAAAEKDARAYGVALLALPQDLEANKAKYETVFTHALYALTPLK